MENINVCEDCDHDPPVHPADQHVVGEAHPAPELETRVGHLSHQTTTFQLTHGGQLSYIPVNRYLVGNFSSGWVLAKEPVSLRPYFPLLKNGAQLHLHQTWASFPLPPEDCKIGV